MGIYDLVIFADVPYHALPCRPSQFPSPLPSPFVFGACIACIGFPDTAVLSLRGKGTLSPVLFVTLSTPHPPPGVRFLVFRCCAVLTL